MRLTTALLCALIYCSFLPAGEVESKLSGKDLKGPSLEPMANLIKGPSNMDAATAFGCVLSTNPDPKTLEGFAGGMWKRRNLQGKTAQLIAVASGSQKHIEALHKSSRTREMAAAAMAAQLTMIHLGELRGSSWGLSAQGSQKGLSLRKQRRKRAAKTTKIKSQKNYQEMPNSSPSGLMTAQRMCKPTAF